MEPLAFLTEESIREIRRRFGTPVFVYDQENAGGSCQGSPGFPECVRIDRPIRDEGPAHGGGRENPEPGGHAHRRQQRFRSGTCHPGRRISGSDPAHCTAYAPESGGPGETGSHLQRLFAAATEALRRTVSGPLRNGTNQPGSRIRAQQKKPTWAARPPVSGSGTNIWTRYSPSPEPAI